MTDKGFSRDFVSTESSRSRSSSSSSSSSSSGSSIISTTTITTEPGVRLSEEQWEELADYYERCIGVPLSVPMGEEIKEYNEYYHIGYDVLRMAMRETGLARRPTPRYLLAILDRCAGDDITTLDEWKAAQYSFRAERTSRCW